MDKIRPEGTDTVCAGSIRGSVGMSGKVPDSLDGGLLRPLQQIAVVLSDTIMQRRTGLTS
jgi:hypothetical protein